MQRWEEEHSCIKMLGGGKNEWTHLKQEVARDEVRNTLATITRRATEDEKKSECSLYE
jgi:hypothetical protein